MNNTPLIKKIAGIKPNPAYNVVIGNDCAESIVHLFDLHVYGWEQAHIEALERQKQKMVQTVLKMIDDCKFKTEPADKAAKLRIENTNGVLKSLEDKVRGLDGNGV